MRTELEHRSIYGVIASITDIVWFPVIETSSYISPTYTINGAYGGFVKDHPNTLNIGGFVYE